MAAAQTLTFDRALPAPCVCPTPEKGQLPERMYWAARHGLLDDVKTWLREGGDVNAADHEGDTMLRGACRGGQNEVLRELLSYPNLHLNVRDGELRTPLMKAARRGQQLTISMLCAAELKCKLDYTAVDDKGNTALSLAVVYGHWEVALMLLQERHPYDKKTLDHTLDLALKLDKENIVQKMTILGYSQTQKLTKIKNLRVTPKVVTPSPSELPDLDITEVYERTSVSSRGCVCILNYKQFRSRTESVREGSEIDFMSLESLFTDLEYEVQGYWNLTKDMTLTTLSKFSKDECLKSADCAIIVIMSHGKRGPVFQTSDMQYITVSSVMNLFSDSECPHLKGKPKIFLFNFCRGSQEPSSVTTDDITEPPRDMLCMYSTTESFVSYRDTLEGSPFIMTLCDVIKKYHKTDHILDIKRKFQVAYKEDVTPEIQDFRFQKKFYF